jgi:subtilase family serine protease
MRTLIWRTLGVSAVIGLGLVLLTPSVGLSQAHFRMGVTGFPPSSPHVLKPGAEFSVQVTVTNQSPDLQTHQPVAGTLAFSLVSTTGSARQNLFDKGAFVKVLKSGESTLVKVKLGVPPDTRDGTYYLGVCLTFPIIFNECRTFDGPLDRTVTVENGPDLVITAIGNLPRAVPQGHSLSVKTIVKNVGFAPAGQSTTTYSLVSAADNASTDLDGVLAVPALGVNKTFTEWHTVTVGAATVPGSYRVRGCADSGMVVAEKDDQNNCRMSEGTVRVTPRPDLVVTSVTVRGAPLTVDPKAILSITAVLENRGLADAATSGLKFVLVDSSGAPTKHLTGKLSAPVLLAGTTVTVQGRAKVVAAAPPGVYRVQACADSGKKVDESDENNNCVTAPGTVTVTGPSFSPAPLALTALTDPPASALPGDAFEVTATVENYGTGASPATTTTFYLLSASGTREPLRGVESVPGLAAGATNAVPVTVALHGDTAPGSYVLQACAEDHEGVPEADETDRCRTSDGQITVHELPTTR